MDEGTLSMKQPVRAIRLGLLRIGSGCLSNGQGARSGRGGGDGIDKPLAQSASIMAHIAERELPGYLTALLSNTEPASSGFRHSGAAHLRSGHPEHGTD